MKVVVTGMGCISPCGNTVRELWTNLCAGRSGVASVTRFDAGEHDVKIAAEVKDFPASDHGIGSKESRRLDLFAQFALAASVQALGDSGLADGVSEGEAFDRETTGVVIGTGMGGLGSIERQCDVYRNRGASRVSPTLVPGAVPDVAASQVALRFGLKGPSFAVSTACASGSDAIILAARYVQDGSAEVMVAGGAEATITELSLATFGNLKALSRSNGPPETVSRPFDRSRSGFVMGEGAGILVLESQEHAERRGAEIHAVLAGFGQSTDAFHSTAPDPTGLGAARAVSAAMRMARREGSEIDYINAHGTSTAANDPMETLAIKTALGERAWDIAISSTKSMTGHLIGAAGGLEAIAAIQAIRTGVIPPTINLDDPDPECDLDYVPLEARERAVGVALSNTFGFGGHNTTLLFEDHT